MSEFDSRARDWDSNPLFLERAEAVAKALLELVPVSREMKALEYGAGTGLMSFLLSDRFSEIVMMDQSEEMVKVMQEKVATSQIQNLKPLQWDLVETNYREGTFDCIFSQMVLHHITDIKVILYKWLKMLNPGGYLAVADLYTEDGSFHQGATDVHKGFSPEDLSNALLVAGFRNIEYKTCYLIKRNGMEYPVFQLVAKI